MKIRAYCSTSSICSVDYLLIACKGLPIVGLDLHHDAVQQRIPNQREPCLLSAPPYCLRSLCKTQIRIIVCDPSACMLVVSHCCHYSHSNTLSSPLHCFFDRLLVMPFSLQAYFNYIPLYIGGPILVGVGLVFLVKSQVTASK